MDIDNEQAWARGGEGYAARARRAAEARDYSVRIYRPGQPVEGYETRAANGDQVFNDALDKCEAIGARVTVMRVA